MKQQTKVLAKRAISLLIAAALMWTDSSMTTFATEISGAEATASPEVIEEVIEETVEATPSASPTDEDTSDVAGDENVQDEENIEEEESPTPTIEPTLSPEEDNVIDGEIPVVSSSPSPEASASPEVSASPTASEEPTPSASISPSPSATPSATPQMAVGHNHLYAAAQINHIQPEAVIDASELNYTFKSETDQNINSLNGSNATSYRLLLFAPVEDFRTADLWGDYYFYNLLLFDSDYVRPVVLDTGRSTKARVKEIHQLETEFLKYVSGTDNSVYCYDTQADDEQNQIWTAYNAFCDLCEGMEPAIQTESGEPCASYFLIDENNHIVCYGYGQNYFNELWSYVQDNPIVPPARPENIEVTNIQGEVSFSWNVTEDIEDVAAYAASEDGSYIGYDIGVFEINNGVATYTIYTGATGEEENDTYTMAFRNLDDYSVKSDYSDVATNEGMECEDNPDNYKEVCLIDENGNAIEKLTLHQGETMKLRVQLEKNSGDKEVAGISDEVEWYISSSDQEDANYIYEDTPVKYWPGELADTSYFYFKGTEITETDYYLHCYFQREASSDSLGYDVKMIVPVEVVVAEDGKSYPTQNPEAPIDLYTDKETVKQTVYNNLQNKEEIFTIAVKESDWEAWDIEIYNLIFKHTDPSIPWIEQYTESYAGMVNSPVDSYNYRSVTVKGIPYRVYRFFVEYEAGAKYFDYADWVDNKIKEVVHTPGGALYQYKNADDYTKTKAVYDYVRKTISYIGTTDMTHHTVYGAWKSGKGTCDGYAQMMYRLLWEMGVSNCCMTDDFTIGGTSVHAYNIVELDGACYYLDASAGLFLKGKNGQEHDYQTSYLEVCREYVENLSENDYVYVPKNIQLSKTTGGVTEKIGSYNAFSKAMEAITEDGAAADNYTLLLTDDMSLSDESLNNSSINLNLDLNGHTLNVIESVVSNTDMISSASGAGVIKVANNETFTIVPKPAENTSLDNITFAYDGSNAQLVVGTENLTNKVIITNLKDGKAARLRVLGIVEMTGNMTALNVTLSCAQLCAENLTVTEYVFADPESKIRLSGTGSFKDMSLEAGSESYDESYAFTIDLLKSEDKKKNGTLKFSGSLINNTFITKALRINKYICSGENEALTEFASGEEVAIVTSAKNVFPEKYIQLAGESSFVEREGNCLKAAKDAVIVRHYDDDYVNSTEKTYSSLEKAIAGIGTDFANAQGNYTFTFVANNVITKDITVPACVRQVNFFPAMVDEGESGYYELDLNGKTLSFAGQTVIISEGIHVKSSADGKNAKIKMTANASSHPYLWMQTEGSLSYVNESGNTVSNGTDRYLLTNVDISAPNAQVDLRMSPLEVSKNVERLTYHIEGAIEASQLYVAGNNWKTGDIDADYFYIQDSIRDSYNEPVSIDTQMTAGNIKSQYLDNRGILWADSLELTKQKFYNEGKAEIKTIKTISNLDLWEDSILVCDSLNQISGGSIEVINDAVLVINEHATIQTIGVRKKVADGYGYVLVKDGCTISMQGIKTATVPFKFGKLATTSDVYLDADGDLANASGKLEVSENGYQVKALEAQSLLFSTANKAFPVENISIMQPDAASTYVRAYQLGQNVYVGGEWITVKAMKADGTDTGAQTLKKFIKWTDASAYLATLSNSSMTYIVEISEDVNTMESLTLPTQAKKVIFRGTSSREDGRITFGYVGDIKLSTNVTFENIDLNTVKYDKNSNTYVSDVKTLNLNGKELKLINSTASVTAVSGNAGSNLYVTGTDKNKTALSVSGTFAAIDLSVTDAKVSVGKTVTVTNAYLSSAEIKAEGAVTIKETLSMENATLDGNGKITIKNLITNDDKNKLIFADNSRNSLTISGEVSSAGSCVGNAEVKLVGNTWNIVEDEEGTAQIRKAAIDISVKSLAGKYSQDVALLNATKATSGWFVVGSVYGQDGSRSGLKHLTHKDGNVIKCNGDAVYPIVLESLMEDEPENSNWAYGGNFKTVQEAFSEIDRLANTKGIYKITITEESTGVSDITKALTFPSKAEDVTVVGLTNEADGKATISYKGGLTLKCNLTLQNIALNPSADKAQISLGNYGLIMNDCVVADGKTIGKISGSGIAKTSSFLLGSPEITVISGEISNVAALALTSSDLKVKGKLTVGELYLEVNTLEAEAAISVTNIYNEAGSGNIYAPATVTRNKAGDITKIVPQLTINGVVEATGTVGIGLTEKTSTGFELINFEEAAENYLLNGIQLAKAQKVSTDKVTCDGNNTNTLSGVVTKKGGYLTFYADADYGVKLTYQEDGETVVTNCLSFADAVSEINTLKTKRDYTIYLTETATNWEAPGTIKMPNNGTAQVLTIAGEDDAITNFYYTGGLSFTSDTVIKNVNFLQMMKSDGIYVEAAEADYPAAVKVSSGGFALAVDGEVFFNTPVTLEGGNKGTFEIKEDGIIVTTYAGEMNEIYGSISKFAKVSVGTNGLTISKYESKKDTYTGGDLQATDVIVNDDGYLTVQNNITVTNTGISSGEILAEGKGTFTNVTLSGSYAGITVDKEFVISGTLTSTTDDAHLKTRKVLNKDEKKCIPYLNVKGNVVLGDTENDRIYIGVYPNLADTSGVNVDEPVKLTSAPNATAQLLTASKADAQCFRAEAENLLNVNEYSATDTNGYILSKVKDSVLVYYANDVEAALCVGDVLDGELLSAQVQGYYTSFKDAVAAVKAKKDKNAQYTILLLKNVGSATAPIALELPSETAKLYIKGAMLPDTADTVKTIYYSGNITLKSATVFENVDFAPTKKGEGTQLNIAAGSYDLYLKDVSVGNATDVNQKTSKMAIKDVTGKSTLTLDSENLEIGGIVKDFKNVVVLKDATVAGNLTVTGLTLKDASITGKKTVTVTDITNNNGTLVYCKDASKVSNLTIKGRIENADGNNPVILSMQLSANETRADQELTLNGVKADLAKTKKIAAIEKAPLSDFTLKIVKNGVEESTVSENLVKADKAVYLVNAATDDNAVLLEVAGKTDKSKYLDFSQAVKEINTLSDKTADYTISVVGTRIADTNMTDTNAVSELKLPDNNKANSVIISGGENAASNKQVYCKGGVSYQGELELRNLTINADSISVPKLCLDDTKLTTVKKSSVTDLVLTDTSAWNVLEATTVRNIDITNATVTGNTEALSYLATKQDKNKKPMLTVNGVVSGEGKALPCKLIKSSSTNADNIVYFDAYRDENLVVAPIEAAEKFIAFSYLTAKAAGAENAEGIAMAQWSAYKDAANCVKNGNKAALSVMITEESGLTTYAKSFEEAVAIIDNAKDMQAVYTITLRDINGNEENIVKTAGGGNTYGALKLPSKAKAVTIKGESAENKSIMMFTGEVKPGCDLTFENVLLTDGKVSGNVFTKSLSIALNMGNYSVTFDSGAGTEELTNSGDVLLVCTKVSGKKALGINGQKLTAKNANIDIKELHLSDDAQVYADKGIKVATLYTEGDLIRVETPGTMVFTDVIGEGQLALHTYYTSNELSKAATQLTISGNIKEAEQNAEFNVNIFPYICRDTKTKIYTQATATDITALTVTGGKPASFQKIAIMPKEAV